MILVTLHDGTRRQIEASDINQVEPLPSGSIIYLVSGDALEVQQDFRTIAARVSAVLAAKVAPDTLPSDAAVEAEEELTSIPTPTPTATIAKSPLEAFIQRTIRMLCGWISMPAFLLGRGREGRS
jgi:uncharacterized protein YlzI (FlbEa/FlbD family)